ncbi:Conserved hypothetical protein [Prochlorococcus marinus str. MIT 9313]|uniref:Uncharacterized protein n=1 Tax=Prochlorococcus marinus (strain MIT 9313) TaxID=74547 RepID=B9ERD2_PROMM|nr:Hypothetical protein PMT_2294 [Prochlorococcus marinus str. MIT 9313]CAX32297.1 Conserved hypothetical protein [Prochlorococcus marinus str. MIT 9313]
MKTKIDAVTGFCNSFLLTGPHTLVAYLLKPFDQLLIAAHRA